MHNKISCTGEKNHKHRKKKKKQKQTENHSWAGEKQLLPKSPEVTSKGENSNKHF